MKKYKLIDTSTQVVIYECTVEASSPDEAIKKANWVEVSNDCIDNEIEATEITIENNIIKKVS